MSWDEIIEQDDAKTWLRAALQNDRLAHAYLFVGPAGVGKRTTARVFARAILCAARKSSGTDPCNACGPCRRVRGANHPDYHELAVAESDRQIRREQLEPLVARMHLKAFEGLRKFFMIPGVERLNETASNMFLKTLEEPPADTVIVLTAASESLLLPTIVSRMQRIRFQALSEKALAQVLIESGTNQEDARTAAAAAGGSLERARLLGDPTFREQARFVAEELLRPGSCDTSKLAGAFIERVRNDAESAPDGIPKAYAFHHSARKILDLASLMLRDAILMRTGGDQSKILLRDRTPAIQALAQKHTADALLCALDATETTGRALVANARAETASVVLAGLLVEALAEPAKR